MHLLFVLLANHRVLAGRVRPIDMITESNVSEKGIARFASGASRSDCSRLYAEWRANCLQCTASVKRYTRAIPFERAKLHNERDHPMSTDRRSLDAEADEYEKQVRTMQRKAATPRITS